MTKVIDLTKEAKELKPIQLTSFLLAESREMQEIVSCIVTDQWDKLYLLSRNYRGAGLDLMIASNKDIQCLYLGHFNDGIV